MTDLVVLSLESWDAVWRRNQHLIAGLLRRDPTLRVLFVEPAVDPIHEVLEHRVPTRAKGLRPGPALDGVGGDRLWLYEPTKWLPRRVDPNADDRLARRAIRAVCRLGMQRPLLWINDPDGVTVLQRMGWPTLYDVTDDWTLAPRSPAAIARTVQAEDLLLSRCAEVVVCSPALAASKGARRPVTLIPNAVDVDAYRRPRPRPADAPAGPYALYVGTVHSDRIDVELCVRVSEAIRGLGSFVLVGPALVTASARLQLEAAGVILAGPRPASEVPAYLQHASVLLVPHVVTPFTDSLDPIKLYEYRAVGRPVVSTPVAGFRDHPDPRIAVAQGPDFARLVKERLASPEPGDTAPASNVPSWDDRVEQMASVLERMAN